MKKNEPSLRHGPGPMLSPTPVMAVGCSMLCLLGLAAGFSPLLAPFWHALAAMLIGVCLVDLFFSRQRPPLHVERIIHRSLPVTAWTDVELRISNHGHRSLALTVHDFHPAHARCRALPLAITPEAGRTAVCRYGLYPTARGRFSLPGTDLVVDSPLRLWRRKWFFPCPDEIMVFPNFREISRYMLLATHHRLSLIGIKQLAKRGAGKQFHQLREYRQGDSMQTIDWKATSRHMKLISKEYQDERDQQIIFVLDSGRRMSHVESHTSHLDQALSSVMLLAYVASRQGDAVGLYSFGATNKWHPPRKDGGNVRSLLLAAYDIQSGAQAADFQRATQELLALQRRRALMIIITNSRSEDHDDLLHMARQLRKKHLVVIADLRESVLDENLERPISGFAEALRYQALRHYLIQRKNIMKQLDHLGILTLDVTADRLPASLVNRYLEIKRSGAL